MSTSRVTLELDWLIKIFPNQPACPVIPKEFFGVTLQSNQIRDMAE